MMQTAAPIDGYIGRPAREFAGGRQGCSGVLFAESKELFEYRTVLPNIEVGSVSW